MKLFLLASILCVFSLNLTAQSFTSDFTCDFDAPCFEEKKGRNIVCDFVLSPNPTEDIVQIYPPPQYITVWNTQGRNVGNTMDLSNLPQGLYFLRIKSGDCETTKKVIKL